MRDLRGVWLLDPRFDFLLPWFCRECNISDDNVTLVGSYHGPSRRGRNTVTIGDTQQGHIFYLEPEEINRRFAAQFKQDMPDVVAAFSGAYLPADPPFRTFLATGEIAVKANHKGWQYDFFLRHGIPTPKTWSASDPASLRRLAAEKLEAHGRLVVKTPELSGGYQMAVVTSAEETDRWLEQAQRESAAFLVSEYIPHTQSFSGMGLVTREGAVHWICATEQVLYSDLSYEGMIYPPFAAPETVGEIERLTCRIGEGLSAEGYFGFFNVDFIFGDAGLQAVEINARFGFGTLFYACACGASFWAAVQGAQIGLDLPESRMILGKIKGRHGRVYQNLKSESDILRWYRSKTGRFQTFFSGTEAPERFDGGSFIGLFGAFLDSAASRDAVLDEFWKSCLAWF